MIIILILHIFSVTSVNHEKVKVGNRTTGYFPGLFMLSMKLRLSICYSYINPSNLFVIMDPFNFNFHQDTNLCPSQYLILDLLGNILLEKSLEVHNTYLQSNDLLSMHDPITTTTTASTASTTTITPPFNSISTPTTMVVDNSRYVVFFMCSCFIGREISSGHLYTSDQSSIFATK